MMRSKVLLVLCSLGVTSVLAGCNKNADDEHARAAAAQTSADQKIGKTEAEVQNKANEAQTGADKKVAEAIDTANEKSAKAQTEANEKIRDANEKMLSARNDLREWAQKRMNEIDNDIDHSKTKAQTASSTAKANFEKAMQDVESQRKNVQGELASMDSQAAAGLPDYKSRLEKAFDDFKGSVDRLGKSL